MRETLCRLTRLDLGLLLLAALLPAAAGAEPVHPAFVDAATVVPGLEVEMRYAGPHNFVGAKVTGYEKPVCLLTKEAAAALAKAQIALASSGVGLKVFDCYRPARAVAHFVRWSRDLKDTGTKGEFYPDVDKKESVPGRIYLEPIRPFTRVDGRPHARRDPAGAGRKVA